MSVVGFPHTILPFANRKSNHDDFPQPAQSERGHEEFSAPSILLRSENLTLLIPARNQTDWRLIEDSGFTIDGQIRHPPEPRVHSPNQDSFREPALFASGRGRARRRNRLAIHRVRFRQLHASPIWIVEVGLALAVFAHMHLYGFSVSFV